jgi:Xanthosine triphosphate pyrophosphatase
MEKIFFVTSNEGKVITAKKHVDKVDLIFYKYDLIEPRSESLEEIAKYKVMQAYKEFGKPCIALDSGFYIENLNGWPGTFVNFNLENLGLNGILKLLKNNKNRKAYFKECLAYYDGKEIRYFYGVSSGRISEKLSKLNHEEQWSKLWRIFIPDNHDKTMSDMTKEERNNRRDNHTNSFIEFNNYKKSLDKKKF